MSFMIIDITHHHCAFTIARQLRTLFFNGRFLLHCLFSDVSSIILRMFHKGNKSEHFSSGFIYILHIFGMGLK